MTMFPGHALITFLLLAALAVLCYTLATMLAAEVNEVLQPFRASPIEGRWLS